MDMHNMPYFTISHRHHQWPPEAVSHPVIRQNIFRIIFGILQDVLSEITVFETYLDTEREARIYFGSVSTFKNIYVSLHLHVLCARPQGTTKRLRNAILICLPS